MKRISSLIVLLLALLPATAQDARAILDATAARMTQSGCVRATFKATQFHGSTVENETTGTMLISGRKFQMQTPDLITWFDGKTQWSMLLGSDEVNVSEPTEEELATMNPSALIYLYRQGYNYKARKKTLRGRQTYEVHLKAKSSSAAFSEIYVDVERETYDPLCIRAKSDGNWIRLSILTFQPHQTATDATFSFPAKEYPGVEVIDLR